MKRRLLTAAVAVGLLSGANAQMQTGDISPDWTMDDYLGNATYTMSDYLDAGKTVFIDLSATWCSPCWSFHQTGALEDLYVNHGPAGDPGVDAGTTDDVMVFFFESDASTTQADLEGTGSNTMGDWRTGIQFPIMDGQEPDDYAAEVKLTFYPTMIKICPDRSVEMFNPGGQSGAALYGKIGACGPLPTETNDAKLVIDYTVEVDYCETAPSAQVKMQNLGSANLTSATVKAYNGATEVGTVNWTGNLAPFEATLVPVALSGTGDITISKFEITTADENSSNNTLNTNLSIDKVSITTGVNLRMDVETDNYASEFGFMMRNTDFAFEDIYSSDWQAQFFDTPSGDVVESMFTYNGTHYGSQNGIGNNEEWTMDFELSAGCHSISFFDTYGDGMPGGKVHFYGINEDESLEYIYKKTGSFAADYIVFEVDDANTTAFPLPVSVDENIVADFKIYPNPTSGNSNVEFNVPSSNNVSVSVINTLGQVVLNNNLGVVSGAQKVNINGANLENGIYFVNIKVGEKLTTEKLTVSK